MSTRSTVEPRIYGRLRSLAEPKILSSQRKIYVDKESTYGLARLGIAHVSTGILVDTFLPLTYVV